MKILIIDDEVKLADAIGELFRQNKYVVDVVYDGEDGLYCAKNGHSFWVSVFVFMVGRVRFVRYFPNVFAAFLSISRMGRL